MKSLLLLLALVSYSFFCPAQNSKVYDRLAKKKNFKKGFITLLDSTELEGLINATLSRNNPKYLGVELVNIEGERKIYYASELLGYKYEGDEFASTGRSFCKLISSGNKVNLYETSKRLDNFGSRITQDISQNILYAKNIEFEKTRSSKQSLYSFAPTSTTYYVRKIGETFAVPAYQNKTFHEEFSEYFSDCPELSSYILNKEFLAKDMVGVVKKYNDFCDEK